jgi:hypothetical protein
MSRRSFITATIACTLLTLVPVSLISCTRHKETFVSIPVDQRVSKLETELQTTQEQFTLRTVEYDKLSFENGELRREKDVLVGERLTYPRNTPEDVEKENKSLRLRLLKGDGTADVGYKMLCRSLESNADLRAENYALKKSNQKARILLEIQGIYLDCVKAEEIDPTETPLAIEKAEHNATKRRLERVLAERDAASEDSRSVMIKDNSYIDRLRADLSKRTMERDKYERELKQYQDYVRSLGPMQK